MKLATILVKPKRTNLRLPAKCILAHEKAPQQIDKHKNPYAKSGAINFNNF